MPDPNRFGGHLPSINELGTCINADPVFVTGPAGSYYLDPASPAVDTGSDTAANLGMDTKTTDAGGALDAGTVDIGYHYDAP